jgi:ectoine hydroxylase-related dioxygenase (phytanoyl-CoA dioxygenase family)/quercetin dioxygenase-like cupin family protein
MSLCLFSLITKTEHLQQMQQEVQLLEQQHWCSHVNKADYQGGWDVLALRCAAQHQYAHVILQSFAIEDKTEWLDLPLLDQLPSVKGFLQQLPVSIKSVRLMRLQPGAVIKPHRDHGLCLEQGEARLHLPLQSNPELRFYVAEQLVPLQEGELWYINADQMHWVENKGSTARINLVIDCAANDWLMQRLQNQGKEGLVTAAVGAKDLVPSSDLSLGGVFHLYRLWQKIQLRIQHQLPSSAYAGEWVLDTALLDLCGIGLEPGMQALHQFADAVDIELWIQNRGLTTAEITQVNQQLQLIANGSSALQPPAQLLSDEQQEFWHSQGYLVIPSVLSKEQCQQSCEVIWQYLQANPAQPHSWYQSSDKMQKIMLQLFRHPVLDSNRQQPLIRQVYEQLWQRTDLVMSTDRVSFNPPETQCWSFPGPDLHWDVELVAPVPFATQGLVYLTDTTEQQGAFCCVPGFHLKIDDWITAQNKSPTELQQQDWADWPVKAIAAKAGDLIVWHQALPHGASRNTADKPRMVQYINMYQTTSDA